MFGNGVSWDSFERVLDAYADEMKAIRVDVDRILLRQPSDKFVIGAQVEELSRKVDGLAAILGYKWVAPTAGYQKIKRGRHA